MELLYPFGEHLLSPYTWSGSVPDTEDTEVKTGPAHQECRKAADVLRKCPVHFLFHHVGTALNTPLVRIDIMSCVSARLAYTLSSTLGTLEDTVTTSIIGRHHILSCL